VVTTARFPIVAFATVSLSGWSDAPAGTTEMTAADDIANVAANASRRARPLMGTSKSGTSRADIP
jgi:hypothetical protein